MENSNPVAPVLHVQFLQRTHSRKWSLDYRTGLVVERIRAHPAGKKPLQALESGVSLPMRGEHRGLPRERVTSVALPPAERKSHPLRVQRIVPVKKMVGINHEKMRPVTVGRVKEFKFVADLEAGVFIIAERRHLRKKVLPLREHRVVQTIFPVNLYERRKAPAQIGEVVVRVGSYFSEIPLSVFGRCS